jgi:hypothetical protein
MLPHLISYTHEPRPAFNVPGSQPETAPGIAVTRSHRARTRQPCDRSRRTSGTRPPPGSTCRYAPPSRPGSSPVKRQFAPSTRQGGTTPGTVSYRSDGSRPVVLSPGCAELPDAARWTTTELGWPLAAVGSIDGRLDNTVQVARCEDPQRLLDETIAVLKRDRGRQRHPQPAKENRRRRQISTRQISPIRVPPLAERRAAAAIQNN